MCLCVSTNDPKAWQTDPPVVFDPPPGLTRKIAIDACIAGAIQSLWDAGIWTRNSCCGHGAVRPSVILDQPQQGIEAARVLATDGRQWDVLGYVLQDVSEGAVSWRAAKEGA